MSVVLLLTREQARAIATTSPDARVRAVAIAALEDYPVPPRAVLLHDFTGTGLEVSAVQFDSGPAADRMFERMWTRLMERIDADATRPPRPGGVHTGDAGARPRGRRDVARRRGARPAGGAVRGRDGHDPVCPVPAADCGVHPPRRGDQ